MNNEIRQPNPQDDYVKWFHEIYEEHNPLLYRIVRKHVRPEDVNDVLQEIWYKVHLCLNQLEKKEKLRSWLNSITRNRIKNHYRKKGRNREWVDDLDSLPSEPQDDPWPNSLKEMDMKQVLQGLSEEHQEVIDLHIFRDLSLLEISRKIHVTQGTLKSRLFRAKAAYRKASREYFNTK